MVSWIDIVFEEGRQCYCSIFLACVRTSSLLLPFYFRQ